MSRLGELERDALRLGDQARWDKIAATHGGRMGGPFGVFMRVPQMAERVTWLEEYFRFEGQLPHADRELVIIATTREAKAAFAYVVHERAARRFGTRDEAIEAVRKLGGLEGLTARERLLVEVARTLCRTKSLPDALYAAALAELGEPTLVETVTLVGYYSLVGLVLNSFEVPADADPGF